MNNNANPSDDFSPDFEYDFSNAVRGKHYNRFKNGYTVRITRKDGTIEERRYGPAQGTVIIDADLRAKFPDSDAVNKALRSIAN